MEPDWDLFLYGGNILDSVVPWNSFRDGEQGIAFVLDSELGASVIKDEDSLIRLDRQVAVLCRDGIQGKNAQGKRQGQAKNP